jgi:predicted DNA-binding transcriptional regulator AlpA
VRENTNSVAADGASDGLLNKRSLAVKLGISSRTVSAWMKAKRLPYVKLNKSVRFYWPDVLAKLQTYRVN